MKPVLVSLWMEKEAPVGELKCAVRTLEVWSKGVVCPRARAGMPLSKSNVTVD